MQVASHLPSPHPHRSLIITSLWRRRDVVDSSRWTSDQIPRAACVALFVTPMFARRSTDTSKCNADAAHSSVQARPKPRFETPMNPGCRRGSRFAEKQLKPTTSPRWTRPVTCRSQRISNQRYSGASPLAHSPRQTLRHAVFRPSMVTTAGEVGCRCSAGPQCAC